MSLGLMYETEDRARSLKKILEEKGYSLDYYEVNEGYFRGNWQALLNESLIYFYNYP